MHPLKITLLIALGLSTTAFAASAAPKPGAPRTTHPAEICRGQNPEEFAKCVERVEAHITDLKEVRANDLKRKLTFKAIPVILRFEDGQRMNAALAYESIDSRIVPAGSIVDVRCERSALPATPGYPFTEGTCLLKYPKLDLHWMDPNYAIHHGKQPDIGVGMDGRGFLDVDFVEMLDPIPANQIHPPSTSDYVRLK